MLREAPPGTAEDTGALNPHRQHAGRVLRLCKNDHTPTPMSDQAESSRRLRFGPRTGSASPSSIRTRIPPSRSPPAPPAAQALDDALAEIEAGRKRPSSRWKVRYGLMLGLERILSSETPTTASGHRAPPSPDRRAGGDAHRADRGEPARRRRGRQRRQGRARRRGRERRGRGRGRRRRRLHGRRRRARARRSRATTRAPSRRYRFRHPTASGKTIAAAGFVEAARHLGILILTHRRLLVDQFRRDLTTEGYGDRFMPEILDGRRAAAGRPDHDPDVRLVRAPRRRDLTRGLPARDLRRGPHRARREDERRDPRVPRAALHRHDRDRAADREAGLRRLPRLGRRPPARRRRPARADRTAPLPARAAGGGDQLGADRRRRLRGACARRRARPHGAQPGGGEPLPRALRRDPRHRLRSRRRARLQPRAGVPRGRAQGDGGLGQDAAARAGRDARGVRARRDQRAHQRPAARRGLELAARHGVHAPRADRVAARLPAAHRPHHAHPPAEGGRHRPRLRHEGVDAQRPRRVAPLAARRGLLPRGRARHAGPAAPLDAPRPPAPVAGAVARPGHAGRAPPPLGDPARVAARRPEVPRRRRAEFWATIAGRQLRFDQRPSSPASSPRAAPGRMRWRHSSRSAPPRTRTGACG